MYKIYLKDGQIVDVKGNAHRFYDIESEEVNSVFELIKRKYDKEGDYDEDEDEVLAIIPYDQIKMILSVEESVS